MTFPEILLWKQIKGKQIMGYDFDRQIPIDSFIVDFYCKDLMLAIEVDGTDHDYTKDTIRQEKLEELGVKFLRFTNAEVKFRMNSVLLSISLWIEEYEHQKPTPARNTSV